VRPIRFFKRQKPARREAASLRDAGPVSLAPKAKTGLDRSERRIDSANEKAYREKQELAHG